MADPPPGPYRGRSRARARGPPQPQEDSPRGELEDGDARRTSPGRALTPIGQDLGGLSLNTSPNGSRNGDNGDEVGNGGNGARAEGGDNTIAERNDYLVTLQKGWNKIGKDGVGVELVTNYYPMRVQASGATSDGIILHQHSLVYEPEQDKTSDRRAVLRSLIARDSIPAHNIADGTTIWTGSQICEPGSGVRLEGQLRDETVYVHIKYVAQLDAGNPKYLQVYNVVARNFLRMCRFTMMGRNYFDPSAAIPIPQHRLSLWPGYIATIRRHEHGRMLYCVEQTHKVIREDNVFQLMQNRRRDFNGDMPRTKEALYNEIVGTIVMANYSKKTFRVDDILWDEHPTDVFTRANEPPIDYMNYYQNKHNLTITQPNQPLLLSKPKARDIRMGRTGDIKLVPEFCRMTGLTPAMRANFSLMRDMGQYLFQAPEAKLATANGFIGRLRRMQVDGDNPIANWDLQIRPHPLSVPGRVMPPQTIIFKDNHGQERAHQIQPNDKGDFTNALKGGPNRLYQTNPLAGWVIIAPERDCGNIQNMVQTFLRVANGAGFGMQPPLEVVSLRSINANAYQSAINQAANKYGTKMQMTFTVIPQNRPEIYSAIKQRCYVDYGMINQCFLSKNVTAKGLMSIATKCMIQMCAKLGGEPWTVKIPLQAMIVGFDVYHGGAEGGKSVAGMVAIMSKTAGQYFSVVSFYSSKEELAGQMAQNIQRCCEAYRRINKALPPRIIFYRDGVGEGQLNFVFASELQEIRKSIRDLYGRTSEEPAKLTFIVVSKRINTRLYLKQGTAPATNPMPGTVVDREITLPERNDFYMIAANTRQGTVSPTNYHIIHDEVQLTADRIQQLSFRLCHMYFNWSGTVAVPAVCQYAHKLAYLTGISTRAQPHEQLENRLYYL